MQFITKYAEISREVKLPYVESGAASGVPVIFLHGITDSWRSFELLLPHLPEWIRAFAVTQRGHGDATRPEDGYSADDFAADVAGFMDTVGLERAVIVGHSMGSFNAQRFAAEYQKRTSALILIGSFTSCLDNRGVKEFYEMAIKPLTDPIPPEFAREFQESTVAKPLSEAFLEMVTGESLKVPARVWKAAMEGVVTDDNSDFLRKIKAPTLLIWGEKDAYFPHSEQEKLLRKIEKSELNVYTKTGHAPHWEEPEKTAADIADFIEQNVGVKRDVSREFVYTV